MEDRARIDATSEPLLRSRLFDLFREALGTSYMPIAFGGMEVRTRSVGWGVSSEVGVFEDLQKNLA
jgi:hypothetical protein